MSNLTSFLLAEAQREIESRPTQWELGGIPVKRCPFCGGGDITLIGIRDEELHWCRCMSCRAEGPPRPTRLTALGIWQNRRLKCSESE